MHRFTTTPFRLLAKLLRPTRVAHAMAKYGFDAFAVSFDNAAASPVVMSNYIDTVNGFNISAEFVEGHAAGDSWVEQLFAGLKRGADVVIGGVYDDTASTGPDVIFNAPGTTTSRTLLITWGGSKTSSMETHIKSYMRTPTRGGLTRYEVTLTITGAITEA